MGRLPTHQQQHYTGSSSRQWALKITILFLTGSSRSPFELKILIPRPPTNYITWCHEVIVNLRYFSSAYILYIQNLQVCPADLRRTKKNADGANTTSKD